MPVPKDNRIDAGQVTSWDCPVCGGRLTDLPLDANDCAVNGVHDD